MVRHQFKTYARIKPSTSDRHTIPYAASDSDLDFEIPRNEKFGYVNNIKETQNFAFSRVFDQDASQEEVFEHLAKPVVLSCLEGYNGTIFAYGQTGSGKTFTMSGSNSWQERGIIPRVFQLLFDEYDNRPEMEYNTYVSFMEVYNENGYDLLDRKHVESNMDEWTKVSIYEDDYSNLHLRNLSIHLCSSEQDGIDLLMMGNFIRQVSSTPMNQASSRSHCIFTIALEGRNKETDIVITSKLHLVDLAGSERAYKNDNDDQVVQEAKYINLSLTYLEQVIVALHEKRHKQRSHIPYRNSMMTTILRDSLGGNCKTVLVANLSGEMDNLEESISTCRFAQRCSMLETEITKNEQMDVNILLKKLERENRELKQDLESQMISRQTEFDDEEEQNLSEADIFACSEQTLDFINGNIDDVGFKRRSQMVECLRIMRDYIQEEHKQHESELSRYKKQVSKYEKDIQNLLDYIKEKERISHKSQDTSQSHSHHTHNNNNNHHHHQAINDSSSHYNTTTEDWSETSKNGPISTTTNRSHQESSSQRSHRTATKATTHSSRLSSDKPKTKEKKVMSVNLKAYMDKNGHGQGGDGVKRSSRGFQG